MMERGKVIPFPDRVNVPIRVPERDRPPYGGKLPKKATIVDLEEYKRRKLSPTQPKLLT